MHKSILHISAFHKSTLYSSFLTPHPHPALLQHPLSLSNVADPSTNLSPSPSPRPSSLAFVRRRGEGICVFN